MEVRRIKSTDNEAYACGVVNHPLIDAMIALRDKPGVVPTAVESVKARVHPLVLELVDRPNPQVGLEGKFSYQHSMAVGLSVTEAACSVRKRMLPWPSYSK